MRDSGYDIIVVGAGHAGCEAAAAAANMGAKVLLITMDMTKIAQMSCNPAMGGIGKGQIIREIDALGGYSGIVSEKTSLQFRMLNRSKGPAMWSPRSQNDRTLFSLEWRSVLESLPNVFFRQDHVRALTFSGDKVSGVITGTGSEISAGAVILTNGTFLNGVIHIGEKNFEGGRIGESSSKGISAQLAERGFETGRMKTGTPPRIDGRSINYAVLEEQQGDSEPGKFSYMDNTSPLYTNGPEGRKKQRNCHIAYTSPEVHEILKTGFEQSPMFQGRIKGLGPRYCPSIEDKINRFSDRDRHQLFVEPEGWDTVEVYLNGFSTSLPESIQIQALRKVKGFEKCVFFRPGYAIEYDFFSPMQLFPSLETKMVEGLYFAGQINGTTGYEEAACQGLVAGINAALKLQRKPMFHMKRSDSYIGVLIDDLITKGTDEPYRMFTSRAEYRISLRQDNADQRLSPVGIELGTLKGARKDSFLQRQKDFTEASKAFKSISISPEEINHKIAELGGSSISQKVKGSYLLSRPGISWTDLLLSNVVKEALIGLHPDAISAAETAIKYEGYIDREKELAGKMDRLEGIVLHPDFEYQRLSSLSAEAREKLSKARPSTLGQASRISGVSPADISVLMVYLGR